MIALLENEEDFSSSKTILEEELEKRGAKCIFTPKFHPELNPVELCYRFFNTNNSNKGCVTTKVLLYLGLSPYFTLFFICRYYQSTTIANNTISFKCRDISNFCRTHNIVGSSKGFLRRILQAEEIVTPEKCRKYFVNVQR